MARSPRKRCSHSTTLLAYERCEPRTMLTIIVDVGDLNSGVAVSDDATGEGYIMFSQTDVHDRFSGIGADNADHFVATRLDGLQWQYNNDSTWLDFEPADGDALVSKVNFSGDSVVDSEERFVQQGIWSRVTSVEDQNDIYVVANRFDGQFDKDEFTVLGTTIEIEEFAPPNVLPSESQLGQIVSALHLQNDKNEQFPGLANFDSDGNALLSWRVHLLPHMGLENLYAQFNLNEAWNSPHNLALADQIPDVYKSLNFESTDRTTFVAVAGEDTWFQLDGTPIETHRLSSTDNAVVVEVNNSRSIVWTSPVDWYYSPANPLSGLGDASEEGFAVATLSGKTTTVAGDVAPSAFANLVDTTDQSILDYEALGFEPLDPTEAMNSQALAILNYESAFMRLPHQAIKADDGSPLLSWRVAILPFLGYNELYKQFNLDEAWDSTHNLELLSQMPLEFQHSSVGDNKTVYLGLDGDGTVFNSQLDRGMTFGQMIDGTSNTILIVEADASEAVEWTRPIDLSYDSSDPVRGLGSQQPDGRFFGTLVDSSQASFPTDQADAIADWASAAGREINDYSILDEDLGSSWRSTTQVKLRQLMLGSLNYESAYMEFPHTIYDTPSGEGSPLLSWRVRILPMIEHGNLYDQFRFDEPWNSDHNLSLLPLMPPIFSTPGVPNGMTVFQGPHGDNTFFSNTNSGTRWQEFQSHDTASILQVAAEHAIEWTRPDDFAYDPATIRSFVDSSDETGFYLALVDGSVHYFDDTLPTELLNKIVSPDDYTDLDLDTKAFHDLQPNQISNNLRRVALGIQDYESAYQEFPHHAAYTERRGGDPLFSWRVEILPFIGYAELYDKFNPDEPWDSDHNLSLIPLMPHLFKHPSVENGMTVTQVISSNWDPDGPLESMFPLTNEVRVTYGTITDGSSNTIMVVETNLDQAVEWTKPQDIVYDSSNPLTGVTDGEDSQGSWYAFADGSVHFAPSNLLAEPWAAAVSPQAGDITDLYSDSSYQYGTIVPNLTLGSEGDDSVVINVTSDTVEVVVNGESQTYPLSQFDPLIFDALAGVDDLTINGPADVDITFSNGTIHVGDLAIIAEGFESLEFGGDVTLTLPGTEGDDIVVIVYENETVTSSLNGLQLLPPLPAEQKIVVETGAGSDRLQLLLYLDQNQTTVEESTLSSFGNYEVTWDSVEFVDIENQQDFVSNFLFFADPDTDTFSVESDHIVINGIDTTITLARDVDDTTGLGSRSNVPMPIDVTGTPQGDTFDFGYTQDGLPLFKFHHLVYFPDSPVTFNGGDGNDTFRINQLEDFLQPIDQAEIRPNSLTIDDYQPISWTSVENQVATDIRLATIYDSVGDDTLRISEDSLDFSGADFSWTLFDVRGADAFSSVGNDSAFLSADEKTLSFTLEGATMQYRGNRLGIKGFDNVFATAMNAEDQTNFSFFNESIVDLTISDGEAKYSSPTNENTVTLSGFNRHTLSGREGDKARYTTNTTSNGDTTTGLGYVSFEGVTDDSMRFGMTGFSDVELFAGTNIGTLTMNGSAETDVLEIRDNELEWTLPRFTFNAYDYDDIVVRGFSGEPDEAIVTGNFDSLTASDFEIYELENINMHVQLLNFNEIDLSDAATVPVVTGRFGDDEFVIDYSDNSGVLNVNGSVTDIIIGQDNTVRLDGLGLIDTLTVIASAGTDARLTENSFQTATGGIEFTNIEAVNIQGPNDSSLLTLDAYHPSGDEILVEDDSVSINYADQMHSVSITGFDQFDIAPAAEVESMNFQDARTASPETIASFDSVSFVGNATFGVANLPIFHLVGAANSMLSLFDSNMDEHLYMREGSIELSNDDRSIFALDFSEYEVTASSGVDVGTLEAPVSEMIVESDGFLFGNVKVIGFESISNFDDTQLPVVRGTNADDVFKVSYLPTSLAFEANDLETQFLSEGFVNLVIDGDAGVDTLTIIPPEADFLALQPDRLITSGASTIWSQIEDVLVSGNATDEITIAGSDGNDILRFSDNTASLILASGTTISASSFFKIDVDAGSGNDVAYLAGTSEGSNTFIGNSRLGRLTTPEQVIIADGFDLVAAVSNSSDDLASFVGTENKEEFFVGPESARMVGNSYTRNASGFNRVIAKSEGGADYANVTDSDQDDFIYARAEFARMEFGSGQAATLLGFQTVRSVSAIGQDVAQFDGSESADRFVASDRFGRLNVDGFSMIAVSYPKVRAIGGGGQDEAFLSDSSGDDFFSGSPLLSYMNGSGFQNTAVNFPRVVALAGEGFDTAEFNGSESDDKFYGNPNLANLSGDGYFQFGSGFNFVRAYGGGGEDSAVLRDSNDVDSFFANAELAYLRNDNFHNEVRDFTSVKAVSVAGADIATFEGSDGDELFHGHRDSSYLEGDGFRNQVNGFTTVNAIGLTGADVANLYDSDEDESFGGRENKAWLQGETYRLQVTDFETVNAFGFQGGTNRFFVDDPDFEWSRLGTWDG